jgi:anion-transporting  ArsA/GET3 family ATPase
MAQCFSERAQRVNALLGHRDTTFLLVTAPQREAIDEGVYFWRRLKEARLPFGGVVVNKVHHDFLRQLEPGAFAEPVADEVADETLARLAGELERTLDDTDLAARVHDNFELYRALAERDRDNMERLTERLDEDCVLCVPYFDDDVHDLEGLAQVNRYLFSSSAERREMLESAGV